MPWFCCLYFRCHKWQTLHKNCMIHRKAFHDPYCSTRSKTRHAYWQTKKYVSSSLFVSNAAWVATQALREPLPLFVPRFGKDSIRDQPWEQAQQEPHDLKKWLLLHVRCRAISLLFVVVSKSKPRSNKRHTVSRWPCWQAICIGLFPSLSFASAHALCANNSLITSISPCSQAICNGVIS